MTLSTAILYEMTLSTAILYGFKNGLVPLSKNKVAFLFQEVNQSREPFSLGSIPQ